VLQTIESANASAAWYLFCTQGGQNHSSTGGFSRGGSIHCIWYENVHISQKIRGLVLLLRPDSHTGQIFLFVILRLFLLLSSSSSELDNKSSSLLSFATCFVGTTTACRVGAVITTTACRCSRPRGCCCDDDGGRGLYMILANSLSFLLLSRVLRRSYFTAAFAPTKAKHSAQSLLFSIALAPIKNQ